MPAGSIDEKQGKLTELDGENWQLELQELRAANKALMESRERLERVLEGSEQGFWEWNLATNTFWVSERFESMLGFAIGERDLSHENWAKQVHPDDLSKAMASIERHIKGETLRHEVEIRCLTQSGEWKWILTRGRIVTHAKDGSPLLMSGTHTDISDRKALEEELDRQKLYRCALLDNLPLMAWLKDEHSRFLAVNTPFATAFGWSSPEALIGRDDFDIVPEDLAESYRADDRHVLETGESKCVEEYIEVDGLRRWIETYKSPVFLHDRIVGTVGAARDISERRELLEKIREQEQKLSLFIGGAPVGIAMFDREMRYLAVSRRFLESYRIADSEVLGRSHYDVFPETPDRWREVHRRGLAGETLMCEEDPFTRADGSVDWNRWEIRPWFTGAGYIGGIMLFTENITARKKAEEALRTSEEKYRSLFDSMDEGYLLAEVLFDEDNRPADILYLEANDAAKRLAGRDFVGQRMRDIDPAYEDYWFEIYGRIALTGEPFRAERYAESHGRWFNFYAFKAGGSPSRVACVFNDVTDRKRAEETLREAKREADAANSSKSRFLAAASHDLRQPLSALNIYVSTLKGHVDPDGEVMLSNLKACIASLSELLSDLLDLSKLDAGVVKINRDTFSLEDLIAPLISAHSPEAKAKGLQLRTRLPAWGCHTDPVLLRRIVGNLIVNAIQYTQRGGVLVGYRRHAAKDWLEIWDTGVGIPAEKTTEIFEEFKQLANDARTRGSGLGLAIVERTAKVLGLQLRVRSRLRKGSMFAIELPLGEVPHLAEFAIPPSTPQRLRVVLIEDNDPLRNALTIGLQSAGHQVLAAASCTAAVVMLDGEAPDIVVSDYRLESETGFQAIATLRRTFAPDLPALVITGDTDPALVRSMASHGIVVLHKPLDMETLLAYMEDATAA